MLMGGPLHAGVVAADARPAFEKLAPAWQFKLEANISASPVAVGNQLFAAAENGNLYALDLDKRSLQWLFHARGGIASTPAVANGSVYFLSRDGRFHALDAASGEQRWRMQTEEGRQDAYGIIDKATGNSTAPGCIAPRRTSCIPRWSM